MTVIGGGGGSANVNGKQAGWYGGGGAKGTGTRGRGAYLEWQAMGIRYRLCGHPWGWGPWSSTVDMKRKRRIDQSVMSVERHKKRYLAALAKGRAPTVAARMAGLARSTVYKWRREDVEFAEAWTDCVEQGLDLLEDRAYQRAMKSSDQLLIFQLRARRPEVYGRSGTARRRRTSSRRSLCKSISSSSNVSDCRYQCSKAITMGRVMSLSRLYSNRDEEISSFHVRGNSPNE